MSEKIKIRLPIIAEGRYDKSTLASIFDATVITTGGFGIFNSKEKQALIKKLAERGGVILLTDSDAGGRQIRSFLSGILPKDKLFHIYIPEVKGKERRKKEPSKSGLLGVEGMTREVLERVLAPFICNEDSRKNDSENKKVTKLDFYNDGLSGSSDSQKKRSLLAARLGLPSDMSANSLIEAINIAYGYEEYCRCCEDLFVR
jgi:ribonuclease M5